MAHNQSGVLTVYLQSMKWKLCLLGLGMFYYSLAQEYQLADVRLEDHSAALQNGMTGGFNAPQFYSIDANLDGLDDLFVFDRDGFKSMLFEAVPDGDCVKYVLNESLSKYFPDLRRFAIPLDYTGDGIVDLFTHSNIGIDGIQVYRGIDRTDHLEFELVELDQNYSNVLAYNVGSILSNVPISRIDLPAIADLDNDGDYDILTFQSNGGYIVEYKNMQVEEGLGYDQIYFELGDECWGKFYESDFNEEIYLADSTGQCASSNLGANSRHNGSTTLVWDPNKDGLPDLLIGDFTSDKIVHLQNGGTLQNAIMTSQDFEFPAYNQSINMATFLAAFNLDVNCDGKKDILVSPNTGNGSAKINNVLYYKNIGVEMDSFEFVADDFIAKSTLDLGAKSAPSLVDVNADGFLDIVMGLAKDESNTQPIEASLKLLLSNGDQDNLSFNLVNDDYLGLSVFSNGSRTFAPAFGDMDNDGDMDLVVGDEEGFLIYGENVAGAGQTISIPNLQYGWMGIDTRSFAVPNIADVNNDGLPDLIIGVRNLENHPTTNVKCGNINYFQNIGTLTEPNFNPDPKVAPNSVCLGEINVDYFNINNAHGAPFFYDTGDSLLMVSGLEDGTVARYRVGDVTEPWLKIDSLLGGVDEGFISKPALGDLDNDGVLELVMGNQRGGLAIYNSNIKSTGELISSSTDIFIPDGMTIFPNPNFSGGELFWGVGLTPEKIAIYDISGRIVGEWSSIENIASIRLPNMATGLYTVYIQGDSKTKVSKLLIYN